VTVAATPTAPAGARPPGPGGPAWANLARYLRDPLGTMTALRDTHGPVAHVPFPGDHSFFFVTDGPLIRRILVDDHAVFVKGRALRAARRLLGDGLLTSEGPEHLTRRRRIQPLFGATPIEGYAPAMAAAAQTVSGRWADGARVDVNEAMMGLALDVVGRTIFDADVESEAPEIRAVLEAGMRVFHRFLLPGADLLWRLPLPATRRFDAAKRDVDRAIGEMLAARPTRPRGGLLDHLLALRDEDGARLLSDEQVRDEAITFVMAGHETTAQALTWAFHLLAANPAARAALEAEVDGVLAGRVPGAEDADRLPYTTAVFRESLRLYPPVWALARIATRPYALGPYRVPEGGTIVTSQWVVHRAPEHFADPLAFRPERWLDGLPPAPGTYFPFAAGPRLCIGERFAILEGVLVLAVLAGRWRVEPRTPSPAIDARFTLRPRGGLPATVRLRRPSPA
jgi:cytochrome P450